VSIYGFVGLELERLRSRYSLFEMKPSPSLSALEKPRANPVSAAASRRDRRPSLFESIDPNVARPVLDELWFGEPGTGELGLFCPPGCDPSGCVPCGSRRWELAGVCRDDGDCDGHCEGDGDGDGDGDCEDELAGGFDGAVLCANANAVDSEAATAATIDDFENDFETFMASPGTNAL
jgi:hypothetical protein